MLAAFIPEAAAEGRPMPGKVESPQCSSPGTGVPAYGIVSPPPPGAKSGGPYKVHGRRIIVVDQVPIILKDSSDRFIETPSKPGFLHKYDGQADLLDGCPHLAVDALEFEAGPQRAPST